MRSKFQFFISFLLYASNSREKKSAHYEEYSDVLLPQVLFETANNTKTERRGFSKRTHHYCPRPFFAVASICMCSVSVFSFRLWRGGGLRSRILSLSSRWCLDPPQRRERGLSVRVRTPPPFSLTARVMICIFFLNGVERVS